jgi:hypothetical protein
MADVRAVKNGNWSDPTVWNTGALPTTADDVFSNNFTVNVDTSFQVLSLRNTSGTSITAGGTFNFNSGSISGSCTSNTSNTSLIPGATNLITITATTGIVTLLLSSSVTCPSIAASNLINYTGGCDFVLTCPTVNGNQILFTAGSNLSTINKASNGTIIINGDLVGGNASNNQSGMNALFATAGNTIVNGSVSGWSSGTGNTGVNVGINQSAGSLIVNGNVTGGGTGGSSTQHGITFSGTSVTINGNIIGGSGTSIGLVCSSAANINVNGLLNASSTSPAISSTGAHTLIYSGSLAASAGSPAIVSNQVTATNIFTGPFYNNGAVMAVQVARMFLSSNSTEWQFTSDAIGVSQSLYTADLIPTYPSASDVRLGTSYSSGSLTGTLAMPQASSVQFGVPVDNTTGSAVLTTASLASAIWDRQRSQLSTTGSIGERLQNVATPTTTGTQISSYLL